MNPENKIQDCLLSFDPSQTKGRIKQLATAVEELKLCLESSSVLEYLDETSKKDNNRTSVTWQDVFRTCHGVVLTNDYEAEEEEKSRVPTLPKQKIRESCLNSVGYVAKKANRDADCPCLQLGSTLNICLEVLKRERCYKYNKPLGTMYLNILYKNIMSLKYYWSQISAEQWKDIISYCMDMYGKVLSAEKTILIKILEICISKGCLYCPLAIDLKNRLDFFEQMFDVNDLSQQVDLGDSLIEVCNTVIKVLSLECRMSVCKLGEKVIGSIVRMRRSKIENEKRMNMLYKFLLVQMSLHHPGGAKEGDGAYSNDWVVWRKHLFVLHTFVNEEVQVFCQPSSNIRNKMKGTEAEVGPALIRLTIEVWKQTFTMQNMEEVQANCLDDTFLEAAAKRRKLDVGVSALIDQLKAAKVPEEISTRLQLLSAMLQAYPTMFGSADYLSLLQVLTHLQSSPKNIGVIRHLCRCCESLLKAEARIVLDNADKASSNQLWDKIWDMTLRSVGLNKCEEGSHLLLQALLHSPRCQPIRYASLLQLLVSSTVRLSQGSVQTLATLAEKCHLPSVHDKMQGCSPHTASYSQVAQEDTIPLWETLLKWLLPNRTLDDETNCEEVPSDILSETLVRLCLKTRVQLQRVEDSPEVMTHQNIVRKIEATYQLTALDSKIPVTTSTNNTSVQNISSTDTLQLNSAAQEIMIELLKNEYNFITEKFDSESDSSKINKKVVTINLIIRYMSIFAHIISYMLQWQVIKESDLLYFELKECLEGLKTMLPKTITRAFLHYSGDRYYMEVFANLKQLYSETHHKVVSSLLRSETGSELADIMYNIAKKSNSKTPFSLSDSFGDDMTDVSTDITKLSKEKGALGILIDPTNTSIINSFLNVKDANSVFNVHSIPVEAKKQLLATNVLAKFCFIPSDNDWTAKEGGTKVLEIALELSQNESSKLKKVHIQKIACIIQHACLASSLSQLQVSVVMEILKNLAKNKSRDPEIALVILSVLHNMLEHVHKYEIEINRKYTISLLVGFQKLLNKQVFGSTVRVCLIKCLGKVGEVDPEQTWLFKLTENGPFPIAADVVEYLKDPFNEVRLSAAHCIKILFCSKTPGWDLAQTHKWHRFVFEHLYKIVTVSFENVEACDKDEVANLTASALQSMGVIIVSSSQWRKKAMFGIIQQTKIQKLDMSALKSMLEVVGRELQVPSVKQFVGANLTFILTQWLSLYKLEQFPWTLLECKSEFEFLSAFQETIVPILIQNKNTEALNYLTKTINKTVEEVVEKCFPKIISCILPFMESECDKSNLQLRKSDVQAAKILHEEITKILGADKLDEILCERLEEIVVCIFKHLHDPTRWQENITSEIPLHFTEADSPIYNQDLIEYTLRHLQNMSPESHEPLLVYLARESPNCIQVILQQLAVAILDAPTQEDRLKAFLQYSTFTEMLSLHLKDGKLGKITAFVVRDIIHFLLNLLKCSQTNEVSLFVLVCITLKDICSKCILHCLIYFECLLPIITNALITTIKKHESGPVANKALQILEFLIVESVDSLRQIIEKMDPFPNNDRFASIQASYYEIKYGMKEYDLEDEIAHFLNAGREGKGNRVEGLMHMRSQLATKKTELKRLYMELHSLRGFSEDCASSLLHQLICVLVKLSSDTDTTISLEAAKCLGELGPSDLSSLVLQPENTSVTCKESSPQVALCKRKIELLKEYLVDSDRSVFAAASTALYSLLQTKEGQQALATIQDHEYLTPFKTKVKVKPPPLTLNKEKFIQKLNDDEIWCPSFPYNHEDWITELVCNILESMSYSAKYLHQLIAVCKTKVEFSVELLPFLVHFILSSASAECKSLVADKINLIFISHYERREKQSKQSELICFNKTSVQCMLNVVQFVRTQEHGSKSVTSPSLLNLNFLHVAQAAQFCSAYFTSLLYAELWGTERKQRHDNPALGFRTIDEICDNTEDGKSLHNILLQGYKKVGDPDALYGCGMSRLLDSQSRIWYYEHCAKWDKVMLMHDIIPNQPKGVISRGTAMALQQSGLHHMLESYLEHQETDEMKALQYECCWRLGKWDLPTAAEIGRTQTSWTSADYDAYHYSALKSMYTSDAASLSINLTNSRKCIIQSLTHANLESSKNIYHALSQLQTLQEIEDFSKIIVQLPDEAISATNKNCLASVLQKWKSQDEITSNQFQYCEPILSQRIALLGIAFEKQNHQEVLAAELHDGSLVHATSEMLLQLAQTSRQEQWFHVSEKALRQLSQLQDLGEEFKLHCQLEDSQNLWAQDNKDMGRHLLLSLITNLNESDSAETSSVRKLQAKALGLYGTWLVDSRSENAQTIISEYFMKAIDIVETLPSNSNAQLVEAYKSLARFADIEYQRVDKYMKSPTFISRQQCMEKSMEAVATLRREQSQTKDVARAININDKQSKLDRVEFENMTHERQKYLELALEYYLSSLDKSTADEEESTVFRIVSLWLDNKTNLGKCQAVLEEKLQTIASYKFLSVVPQLVPHISNSRDKFDVMLTGLLERLSLDHPHHTLPTLLALAELYRDTQYMDKSSLPSQQTPEARVTAAQALIKKLKKYKKLNVIITQMEFNSNALVQLAYFNANDTPKAVQIPSKLSIMRLKDHSNMQVPTLNLPVNRSGQYETIIGIYRYESKYEMVGGITAPKKVTCVGSDGVKRIQLLKGLDDLHQDAVMQQVFTIMNKLLRHNKKTQERKLLVRTYKVVPLSQRSGIIEWCGNTEPIGAYVLSAHPKYYPNDLPPKSCRAKMMEVQRDTHEKRLRVYLGICEKLTPVFHNFFTENFLLPGVWFERRLAYTRSVATNSMIGYILGLGDRHVQNILVDKKTAEVIHIDFGIAFEQGLVLSVPETVPFRLSRDIVDGLGISGVEGVFRKSCEKTMEVLRENQETIVTILQVLLYDPLYVWAISPDQNQNDRKGIKGVRGAAASAVEVNKIAQRALLRLQQKLMGTEEGLATSVEGQVNRLIQQARDPENLSKLFYGWQPYL